MAKLPLLMLKTQFFGVFRVFFAVRGLCPRPLDDGGIGREHSSPLSGMVAMSEDYPTALVEPVKPAKTNKPYADCTPGVASCRSILRKLFDGGPKAANISNRGICNAR